MGSYVPNTKEERQEMLKEIGFQTMDDLFRTYSGRGKDPGRS